MTSTARWTVRTTVRVTASGGARPGAPVAVGAAGGIGAGASRGRGRGRERGRRTDHPRRRAAPLRRECLDVGGASAAGAGAGVAGPLVTGGAAGGVAAATGAGVVATVAGAASGVGVGPPLEPSALAARRPRTLPDLPLPLPLPAADLPAPLPFPGFGFTCDLGGRAHALPAGVFLPRHAPGPLDGSVLDGLGHLGGRGRRSAAARSPFAAAAHGHAARHRKEGKAGHEQSPAGGADLRGTRSAWHACRTPW